MIDAIPTSLPHRASRLRSWPRAWPRTWHAIRFAAAVIVTLLIIAVGIVALGSGSGLIPLPYEMFVLAERMPVVFSAHMLTSAVALLLMPVVILTRHRPHIHRKLGRLVGGFVVAGGLTALPVAIFSDSSFAARAGFFAQALVWLYLLTRGIISIRAGDRRRHMFYMLAMFAVTTGAVWFRLLTGFAIVLQLPFAPVYAAAAWLGWLMPLILVVAYRHSATALLSPHRA